MTVNLSNSNWSSLKKAAVSMTAMLAICTATTSVIHASTLQEPGYTETVIGSIAEATNGFGGMTTDDGGNLYFAANFANEIYKAPPGGPLAQFGTVAGSTANGIVIVGDTLYSSFTASNQVFAQDLTQGAPNGTLVANVSGPMGMAVAPSGFGAFGGQLIIGTVSNGIVALDVGSGVVTPVSNAANLVSDVAFTPDGRLLALPANGQLLEISADGSSTVFASGLGAADGLDVHPTTGEIFVAEPSSRSLIKISTDGLTATPFATDALVDSGYFPSPISFTVDGTSLFYGTRENGTTVYRIDGFDGSIVVDILTVLVTKTFSDGETGDVEVTLSCNGGIPLQQSFTISSDGPGVNFTVTNLPDTGVSCTVTETVGADGYTPSYDNGSVVSDSGCSYSGVTGGAYNCSITNSPSTFDFVVDFEWDDTATGATGTVDVNLYCENVVDEFGVVNTSTIASPDNPYQATATTDAEFIWMDVGTANDDEDDDGDPIDPTTCWAMASNISDSALEVSDCGPFMVSPGEDQANCTMTASIFFEGIPTLSQYGMAILALLMLGMGFVGMRRFI